MAAATVRFAGDDEPQRPPVALGPGGGARRQADPAQDLMCAASWTSYTSVMSRRPLVAALLALSSLAGARAAFASLVLAMDLPALTREAERIVVGEVTSVHSGWDKKHERILSTVEIRVGEMWKGR